MGKSSAGGQLSCGLDMRWFWQLPKHYQHVPFIVADNKLAKSPPISVRMCGLAGKVCFASEVYSCGSVGMSSCWIVYGTAARCPSLWTRPLV